MSAEPRPRGQGVWSQWDKRRSSDLHGSFFFSQFISSRITRLSHTSEEGEDHTRDSVTLCFTNEACTLRLLAFALLPFETATTQCCSTSVVLFLRYQAPGIDAVSVPWLGLSPLRSYKVQIHHRPFTESSLPSQDNESDSDQQTDT